MDIAYGICGEGLGHAGRSLTLIQELSKDHTIHIFTFGEAYKFFKDNGIRNIHEIKGLTFGKKENGISTLATINNFINYCKVYKSEKNRIKAIFKDNNIKLSITDFEPLIPRISHELNVKVISVDNQHKLTILNRALPLKLMIYSFLAGLLIKKFIKKPSKVIITTFHNNNHDNDIEQAPVMIRREFTSSIVSDQGFILVYIKPYMAKKILEILKNVNAKFKIYGAGEHTNNYENIVFCELSSSQFGIDLSKCSRVICCAGNQLVGESRFFGKPVMTIPIPGQMEQELNGWHVEYEGYGINCKLNNFTVEAVNNFINKNFNIDKSQNGLPIILKSINNYINSF